MEKNGGPLKFTSHSSLAVQLVHQGNNFPAFLAAPSGHMINCSPDEMGAAFI